jgi:hypothetical protein
LKAVEEYLKGLLEKQFGAESGNNLFFFQIRHRFRAMFYVDVALYYYDRLIAVRCSDFVEVQTVESHLSVSDSSTGNKSGKSPQEGQKSAKRKKYSEVTIEKCYKG